MVQTIQRTAKKWKALQGCGCASMFLGLLILGLFWAAFGPTDKGVWVGAWIAGIGLAFSLIARAASWWFHA
jgi:hypothetical protein